MDPPAPDLKDLTKPHPPAPPEGIAASVFWKCLAASMLAVGVASILFLLKPERVLASIWSVLEVPLALLSSAVSLLPGLTLFAGLSLLLSGLCFFVKSERYTAPNRYRKRVLAVMVVAAVALAALFLSFMAGYSTSIAVKMVLTPSTQPGAVVFRGLSKQDLAMFSSALEATKSNIHAYSLLKKSLGADRVESLDPEQQETLFTGMLRIADEHARYTPYPVCRRIEQGFWATPSAHALFQVEIEDRLLGPEQAATLCDLTRFNKITISPVRAM